jgi:hypothetical protein
VRILVKHENNIGVQIVSRQGSQVCNHSDGLQMSLLICIILSRLERIRPRIRQVLSMVLQMSCQLIQFSSPQNHKKATPHIICDGPSHQKTIMLKASHLTLLCRLVMLFSCLALPTCHENSQSTHKDPITLW